MSCKLFLPNFISKPKFFKIIIISLFDILNPEIFSNKFVSNLIFVFWNLSITWISILLTSPPQISFINLTALLIPCSIDKGSVPLSNLNLASVSIFNSLDVFLIDLGLKCADSIKTFLVSNSVPDLVPPIIPPKPKTPELSEITHISLSRVYFLLSNAVNFSPFFEFRTIIPLSILSASYAWSGLFKSNIT